MPSKVLFVASSPSSLKFDFAGELAAMEAAADRSNGGFGVSSRWSVDLEGLTGLMQNVRPEVLHLVSPGVIEESLELCLCDSRGKLVPVKPPAFAKALAGPAKSRPRIVLLNRCRSSQLAEAAAQNAGGAIGMRGVVWDNAAVEFSRVFYRKLGGGSSVQEAFEAARVAMAAVDKSQADVPVLFAGREDPAQVRLSNLPVKKPAPVRARKAVATAAPTKCRQIICSYPHKDEK